jgi:lactoylglutathione lyase
MRDYLAAKGVEPMGNAAHGPAPKGQTGNKNFNVKDPDGHIVEIVEYQPDSWTAQHAGKDMPATRISDHIKHVGFLVGDLAKSIHFYGDILGFQETWRGGGNPAVLSWVNLRVPDGEDYVEFMLYGKLPAPDARGTKNHMSLTVPDAQKALEELKKRAARAGYTREIAIRTGVNRKRQINLYDPDGTRVELMEADTIDGRPAPSSTAPPPSHSPAGSEPRQ